MRCGRTNNSETSASACLRLTLQPDNIYEFGAQYFQGMLSSTASKAAPAPQELDIGAPLDVEEAATFIDIANLTPAELEPLLMSECLPLS